MKSFKYITGLLLALVFTACSSAQIRNGDQKLPNGWRTPTPKELQDSWRNEDANSFSKVRGDFNGDGKLDEASFLVNESNKKFGIFVWLNKDQAPIEIYSDDVAFLEVIGIELQKPAELKTVCGKGYMDCKEGEPKSVKLSNDSIDFFKTESANSIFYWDQKKQSFNRVWISD